MTFNERLAYNTMVSIGSADLYIAGQLSGLARLFKCHLNFHPTYSVITIKPDVTCILARQKKSTVLEDEKSITGVKAILQLEWDMAMEAGEVDPNNILVDLNQESTNLILNSSE